MHHFNMDVSFATSAAQENFQYMAWTPSGAIAQAFNQKTYVLWCEFPSEQQIHCGSSKEFDLDPGFVLQENAIFDHGFIVGWAKNDETGKTVLIVANFNNDKIRIFPL
jgi:hypothetical protein